MSRFWLQLAKFAAHRAGARVLRVIPEPTDAEWQAYADECRTTTKIATWDDL